MVTTRSSSKKTPSCSRTDKENATPDINELEEPLCNDSVTKSSKKTGNKLTRELVALGIVASQKRTPKKNLDFEMFSSMTLNTEDTDKDTIRNTSDAYDTEPTSRKEESVESISKSLSKSCSLEEDREKFPNKAENTSALRNNKNFMNSYDMGYKRPTASWIAKEKERKDRDNSQTKTSMQEPSQTRRCYSVHRGDAHYMLPTISNVAKHVAKRST